MKCEMKSSSKKIPLTIASMKWKMTDLLYDILFVIFSYAIFGLGYFSKNFFNNFLSHS